MHLWPSKIFNVRSRLTKKRTEHFRGNIWYQRSRETLWFDHLWFIKLWRIFSTLAEIRWTSTTLTTNASIFHGINLVFKVCVIDAIFLLLWDNHGLSQLPPWFLHVFSAQSFFSSPRLGGFVKTKQNWNSKPPCVMPIQLARACFVLALLNRPVLVGTRRPFVGSWIPDNSFGSGISLNHLEEHVFDPPKL